MRHQLLLKLLIFLIILLGGLQDLHAQDVLQRMTVTPTEAPARSIVVMQEYPEQAVLVFNSPITGLTFNSNMDGIVHQRNEPGSGRYILVIEPWTQIIIIDAPGYMQQRLRVGSPQPRQVLYYDIEPEQRSADLISVIFNVQPEDALLFVDGQVTEINQTVQLAPGSAEVRIEREGYRTVTDVTEVSERNIQFNYSLEEIDIVPVRITSNVEGASVNIDGTERGLTDRSGIRALFLYPGLYSLQLTREGYVTRTVSLEVIQDGANEFTFELIQNVGTLALDIIPVDAKVLINQEEYTGQSLIELAPGRYRLDVIKDNYESYSESIEIKLSERENREIRLKPQTGTLQFIVSPSDAKVELLDYMRQVVKEWNGIQIIRGVKSGRFTLRVTAEGYLPTEERFEIKADEVTEVNLELEQGSLFASNMRQQLLLEEAEIESVRSMVLTLHELFQTSFDYSIHHGEPVATDATRQNWRIPIRIDVVANRNLERAKEYFESVMLTLSISPEEIGSYKNLNLNVYKINQYTLRRVESFNLIGALFEEIEAYVRLYTVDSGIDQRSGFGNRNRESHTFFRTQTRGGSIHTINFLNSGRPVARFEYEDPRTLTQIEQIAGYIVSARGVIWPSTPGNVYNPVTGKTWMNRNLGALWPSRTTTDSQAYGDLYQWGRAADGHEKRNSSTTSTLSNADQPGHGSFITSNSGANWDWRSPQNDNLWQGVNGVNNPCPTGYRLPTEAEWIAERNSWSSNNAYGAFNSPLKLPVAGDRSGGSGSLIDVGSGGRYWSSTVSGSGARYLHFHGSPANMRSRNRAHGRSVRCLED